MNIKYILVLGNKMSGKTNFINKLFNKNTSYSATIGIEYHTKIKSNNDSILMTIDKMVFWDTGEYYRYENLIKNYIYRTNFFIFVFNISNENSHTYIYTLLNEYKSRIHTTNCLIIGNITNGNIELNKTLLYFIFSNHLRYLAIDLKQSNSSDIVKLTYNSIYEYT